MQLNPSFPRLALSAFRLMFAVALVAYFFQGFVEHKWWSLQYCLTLLIPIVVMTVAVWFMFVPKYLRFDNNHIQFQFFLRPAYGLLWSDLYRWGNIRNVLILQFTGGKSVQIAPSAYTPKDWSALTDLLRQNFPDRKARFWFGDRAIG